MRQCKFISALQRDQRGTSAVEYGILLGVIVFAIFAAVSGVAIETRKMWTHVESEATKAHQSN